MTTVVTSTGTVLVDCFEFLDADGTALKPPARKIGGGGLYAIVGARIWLGGPGEARILVDSDGNVPSEVQEVERDFGNDLFVWREGRPTGSAAIVYRGGKRSFAYINQPAPISPCSFLDTPLANARYIHMCAAPAAVEAAAAELAAIRAEVSPSDGPLSTWRPAIVWEPHPQTCRPDQLEDFKASLALVDVCSPNHEEAAALFSLPTPQSPAEYEELAHHILVCPLLPVTSSVVLRCGALGSLVGRHPSHPEAGLSWVPAFWFSGEQDKVRDVTGAGNSFLGGLIAGLSFTGGDIYEANLYASVSASFVVQQFGLPVVSRVGGKALWNGEDPHERLVALRQRFKR